MSDQPIDLRSLAEVDEPEVVRAALRTFRRRLLRRYIWITATVGLVVGAVIWGLQPGTLQERIDAASPTYQGRVWHNEDTAIGLAQIVELRDGVGLHFVAISKDGTSAEFCLQMPNSLDAEFTPDGFEAYFEVPKTDAGSYLLSVCDGARTKTITVNLPALHVPGDLWKE